MPEHPLAAFAFYGRRRGKKLRTYQAGLVEDLLPEVAVPVGSEIIDPAALFAFPPAELWLEIGFGGGEHLAHQAGLHRDVGILGCEPFVNGAAKLLALIEDEALTNIRLHMGDARELLGCLPTASLSRVDILYPDPWPKRRQRKRRLISDELLDGLARILKPGSPLRFATDIDDYAGWVLARILRHADFFWPARQASDWLEPWADWPSTRYEAKAIAEGRPRSYFTFIRV